MKVFTIGFIIALSHPLLEFIRILEQMRFGELTASSIKTLTSLSRMIHYEDGLRATEM
jgi:hypothetical protein